VKVVITGANSAVGLAILRCGPTHGATTTLVGALRLDRAAEEIRRRLAIANGVGRRTEAASQGAEVDQASGGAACRAHFGRCAPPRSSTDSTAMPCPRIAVLSEVVLTPGSPEASPGV
jgi:NAD(P)-dependent dehydrogenase (short-subunit alcohol dehydrogenase family)